MPGALMHPFAELGKAETNFVNIVSGQGATVTDSDGKEYLDGLASLWYCQVGHGRSEIIEAVESQMRKVHYHIFDPFTNDASRTAADMIAARSPFPDGRVFLASSGSEAVDTALKISRQVMQRRGTADKQIIIRRTNGYHGTNFGGTTAQGIELNRQGWGDLVPHFVEVPNDNIEEVAKVFAEQGENIAAVICEPIQGAGGIWPPPDGYLEGLRRLCDQHQALLIFDEVICGFGRTGSWFGSQTFDVTPDLITFAKGVTSGYQPLSGVILSAHVAEELTEPGFVFRHGYTYSGHPAGAAAAVANINLIEQDGLVERAKAIGEKVTTGFEALISDQVIKGYRGLAGIWAIEIGRDAIAVRDAMLTKGVIVRGLSESILFCPPLVIEDQQLDHFVEVLHACLN